MTDLALKIERLRKQRERFLEHWEREFRRQREQREYEALRYAIKAFGEEPCA
jgi:hypothetical protein